ncbi:MAG TPA: hypothetical protein VGB82_21670 [Alphaproteobacteria bacterium]
MFHLGYALAAFAVVAMTPAPARADFFDDVRRTFQTDIPHFFQDDIPCAFGGQPTSGTKKACKSAPAQQAKPAAKQSPPPDVPDANAPVTNAPRDTIEQKQLAPAGASPGSD